MKRIANCCRTAALASAWLAAASGALAGFFDDVPELKLATTEPLMIASQAQPALFGPATGGPGSSYYVFGIGQLTEIALANGAVTTHAITFDRDSRKLYDAGADRAWLGPDRRLYFGLQGKPARIGRYDPATGRMELLGAMVGHAVLQHCFGPGNKLYIITYPCQLGELDTATGKIRDLGRLSADGLYPQGESWVGKDGRFYGATGPRPRRNVAVNLVTGDKTELAELPKPDRADVPRAEFADPAATHTVVLASEGAAATVTITPKQDPAAARTVRFACSTVNRDVQTITVGPDGRIYGSGSYGQFVLDPRTGAITRPVYHLSIYDYVWADGLLYMCGYPNSRLGVFDPARPVETRGKQPIWEMIGKEFNPRQIVCIYNLKNPDDTTAGGFLAMKRAMSMARGSDGKLYLGNTGSRQMAGGALVAVDLQTEAAEFLREPFRQLGIYEVCALDGGKQLALATAVSPDPLAPGTAPTAGKLFVYDVATARIVHEDAPLPDCQILTALAVVPGTRRLAGLGLRGVAPSFEADNHYSGNHDLFLYDLDAKQTVKRIPLEFQADRNFGRAFAAGPDGHLWLCGGGGLVRVDGKALTATPVARVGADGNLLFVGRTLYLGGAAGLRSADLTPFLGGTAKP